MQVILITFFVCLLLRLLYERNDRSRGMKGVVLAVQDEIVAWLYVVAALFGLLALLFLVSLTFGPIPPIHEW